MILLSPFTKTQELNYLQMNFFFGGVLGISFFICLNDCRIKFFKDIVPVRNCLTLTTTVLGLKRFYKNFSK